LFLKSIRYNKQTLSSSQTHKQTNEVRRLSLLEMLRASILCTAIAAGERAALAMCGWSACAPSSPHHSVFVLVAATALQPFQANSVYFADPNGTNTTAPTSSPANGTNTTTQSPTEPDYQCVNDHGIPCNPDPKLGQKCPLKKGETKQDACPSDGCCRGPFNPTPAPIGTPAPTLSPANGSTPAPSTPAPADTPTPPPAPSPATPAPLDPSTVPAEVIVVISNATYVAKALRAQIVDSTNQPASRFVVTETTIGKNDTTLQMTILAQSTPDVNGSSYNDTADAVADLMISAVRGTLDPSPLRYQAR
jgi:hypothetical protein